MDNSTPSTRLPAAASFTHGFLRIIAAQDRRPPPMPSPTESVMSSTQSTMAGVKRTWSEVDSDTGTDKGGQYNREYEVESENEGDTEFDSDSENEFIQDVTAPRIKRYFRHVGDALFSVPILNAPRQPAPVPKFDIYKAIMNHSNLFFQFALRLPMSSLIDLYSIDKDFHWRFNKHGHSLIHDYIRYNSKEASLIFSSMLAPKLCISDPTLKPMDGRHHLSRDIPSIRWIKMVMHRDTVLREIMTYLALDGYRFPRTTFTTLAKFWALMEFRKQAQREAFVSDLKVWTDADIYRFQHFLVKLDMRFGNPIHGKGMCQLSRLLLSQRSMTVLRDILAGYIPMDYVSLCEMVIRTIPTQQLDNTTDPWINQDVGGLIPFREWGVMSQEDWKQSGKRLDFGVDLVIMEGIKRELHVEASFADFVASGFIDSNTGKNRGLLGMGKDHYTLAMQPGRPKEEEIDAVEARLDKFFNLGTVESPPELRIEGYVPEWAREKLEEMASNPKVVMDEHGRVEVDFSDIVAFACAVMEIEDEDNRDSEGSQGNEGNEGSAGSEGNEEMDGGEDINGFEESDDYEEGDSDEDMQ